MDRPEIIIKCETCGTKNLHIVQFKDTANETCMKCGRQLLSYEPVKGYIYILSNPMMQDIYKVGYSTRNVSERVKELSSATGVPGEFVVEEYFSTTKPANDEAKVHEILAPYRIKNKEFFKCELSRVIDAVRSVCGDFCWVEDFKNRYEEDLKKRKAVEDRLNQEIQHLVYRVGTGSDWAAVWEKFREKGRILGIPEPSLQKEFQKLFSHAVEGR